MLRRDPPGENEGAQGREVLVHRVHLALQQVDLGVGYSRLLRVHVLRQRRQDRTQVEKLMLDAQQCARELVQRLRVVVRALGGAERAMPARTDDGIEFVHRAVDLDPQVVLGDLLAADEACLSTIPLARVDAVDGDMGFTEGLAIGLGHCALIEHLCGTTNVRKD